MVWRPILGTLPMLAPQNFALDQTGAALAHATRLTMSTYRLDRLLAPRSVALVGASPRAKSLGRAILNNLRAGGWAGPLHLVNPKHRHDRRDAGDQRPLRVVVGHPTSSSSRCRPPPCPVVVAQSADMGVAAAIIITAGLGHGPGSLAQACEQAARAKGMRIVGPNCLGVLAPGAKLNASFAARMPAAGELALISQSGAIAAGLVDWAAQRHVGFSAIVSIGDQLDVDFGDLLDYFALDRATRAILLYVESIKDARKFMSAARAAARVKPVVVVKGGRQAAGAKAAATHTGALAGSDAVYAAAFHRAGVLRVLDLGELFDAAETLGARALSQWQPARDPDQRRRDRGAGRRPPRRLQRNPCGAFDGHARGTRSRVAPDLVEIESGRHHRRRRSRPATRRRSRCCWPHPRSTQPW